ncbi:hypothetical protein HMPREF9997_02309, partial [Corynebacterium durum F0235]
SRWVCGAMNSTTHPPHSTTQRSNPSPFHHIGNNTKIAYRHHILCQALMHIPCSSPQKLMSLRRCTHF